MERKVNKSGHAATGGAEGVTWSGYPVTLEIKRGIVTAIAGKRKKLAMALVIAMLIMVFPASAVLANPFLVCDPQVKWNGENSGVQSYEYCKNYNPNKPSEAVWETAPLATQNIGTDQIRVYQDLAGISKGIHHWAVRAKNPWGVSTTVPFEFTSGAPEAPATISLEW